MEKNTNREHMLYLLQQNFVHQKSDAYIQIYFTRNTLPEFVI